MPFDSLPQTELTLARLAVVLRDRSMWPEGFEWYYADCATCALGLAHTIKTGSPLEPEDNLPIIDGAELMDENDYKRIFFRLHFMRPGYTRHITPEHVASAIETYLASK